MSIDVLNGEKISKFLSFSAPIEVLEQIDSTNKYLKAKASALPQGAAVIANAQTEGRGRYDRVFYSPENCGIYMSVLLRPEVSAKDAVLITAAAAVCVCEAIEKLFGKKCGIKWVNDILLDSKKICGILAESVINPQKGKIERTVVGIGINVYPPQNGFDKEIKDIAGFVTEERKENLRNILCAEIINRMVDYANNIGKKEFLDKYRSRSIVVGKRINVVSDDGLIPATAILIDEDCRLLVEYDDKRREYLNSGEIGIKL